MRRGQKKRPPGVPGALLLALFRRALSRALELGLYAFVAL